MRDVMDPILRAAMHSGPDPSEILPLDEERVQAFAELLARSDTVFHPHPDDFGVQALARLLAAEEMDGEITYEELEAGFFPRVYPRAPKTVCMNDLWPDGQWLGR